MTVNTGQTVSDVSSFLERRLADMGYAISWLAVRNADRERLIANLGLVGTAEKAFFCESPFTGCTTAADWFVLAMDQCSHTFVQPETLKGLADIDDIVACSIEERAMYSTAELWHRGAEVWRVVHEAELDMLHLAESGALPDEFSSIKKEYFAMQGAKGGSRSDTDYVFEIPLQVAKSIVGFKHDEPGIPVGSFSIFKTPAMLSENKREKPRWKFWLGRS